MTEEKKEFDGPNPGFGALFKNDYKENENHPDFKGTFALEDGKKLDIAAWKRESKSGKPFLSLKISEPYVKDKPKSEEKDIFEAQIN